MRADVVIIGAGPAGLTPQRYSPSTASTSILDSKSGLVDQSRAALVHVAPWSCWTGSAWPRQPSRAEKTNTVEIYEQGKRAASFPLAGKGEEVATPYPFALGLPQHETEQLLVEQLAAHGRAVTWRTTLIGLTVTPSRTTAAVRRSDGTTDRIYALRVVGADGCAVQCAMPSASTSVAVLTARPGCWPTWNSRYPPTSTFRPAQSA